MNRQLSLKKVLLNDYGAFLAWITPIVSIAMYLVLEVTGEKQEGGFDVLLVFGDYLLLRWYYFFGASASLPPSSMTVLTLPRPSARFIFFATVAGLVMYTHSRDRNTEAVMRS